MSDSSGYEYAFSQIEPRWQQRWEEVRAFRAANPGEPGSERPPFYVLDFFPYPSGAGLHVGHPLGYIASDIIARYMRMRGYNVLHPMGWDAFGLPAEQYAIETGVHPRVTTRENIANYRRQLRMIGLGYDWDRELATCNESYYRWTQWIFLKIYHSWYDPDYEWTDRAGRRVRGAARPIETLPIPPEVRARGEAAVEAYQAEHRLAYLAEMPVNWCPALGTVLSNEEVTSEGRSERGDYPVYRRPMKQWMLRITEYAERLLADLEELDWPEPIKLMQRNWIGRSEGAYIDFPLEDSPGQVIRVFTTRPDTVYGATYLVLAPEHHLVPAITTPEQREAVAGYVELARQKSELERSALARVKTGVFTGAWAINPVNRQRIPIWVADYVLAGYGTGSIMGVPGSDRRDLEFAETFGLPVVQVVQPPPGVDWRGYEGDGVAVNSPPPGGVPGLADACVLNGLPTAQAKQRITRWLAEHGAGEGTVQYKLRDWLFSRQRYWGEPFPILYRPDGRIVPVPEEELPVVLPDLQDFRPHASDDPQAEPTTPLSRATDWVLVYRDGEVLRREVNTMPNWAGSCWYYLRFCDPRNERALIDPAIERYWAGCEQTPPAMGPGVAPGPFAQRAGVGPATGPRASKVGLVDLYMGGAEHAVLHLLYARFWHKVLYDLGYVTTPEPFQKLFNQGMILAYAYRDPRGVYVSYDQIDFREDGAYHKQTGQRLTESVEKMSKSLRNVVNPDQVIADYGADTLRLYEMYMGPLEASKPWNTRDIIGVHRFLHRVWRLVVAQPAAEAATAAASAPGPASGLNPRIVEQRHEALERLLHKTIRKVQGDIERFAFNTAIAQMIVWVNEAHRAEFVGRDQIERFLRILAPFAPHIAEELWHRLGHDDLLVHQPWPPYDEHLARDETVEMAVQVNGRLRGRITVPAGCDEEQARAAALEVEAVRRDLAGKTVRRVILVPDRLINLIV